MKVLITNILKEQTLKDSFDRKMDVVFSDMDSEKETIYIESLNAIESIHSYSHLIISGSEASVMEWEPWYKPLEDLIKAFDQAGKPILGICFGHQFLARTYCGESTVQKATQPEFGWTDILKQRDPLFEGMKSIKSLVLHYDEVTKLDERFEVIAQSRRCAIQGFKMKEKPIWGIQFHPDFLYEDTKGILEHVKKHDPNFAENFVETFISEEIYEENNVIFRNFMNATKTT